MSSAAARREAEQVYETRFRVRYAETDQMGVVYNANYLVWFEIGRVEMMRQLGFTYLEMEQQDKTRIPVAEVRCRFKTPACYDDVICVRTRLVNVRESLIRFGYEVLRDSDQALLAEGESAHLVVGLDMKRKPLPKKYLQPFLQAAGRE